MIIVLIITYFVPRTNRNPMLLQKFPPFSLIFSYSFHALITLNCFLAASCIHFRHQKTQGFFSVELIIEKRPANFSIFSHVVQGSMAPIKNSVDDEESYKCLT